MLGCTPYFMNFAIQNFPFIEEKFDGLTDYQLMCKIFKYLDTEIKKVDNKYAGLFDSVEKLEQDFEIFTDKINSDFESYKIEVNTLLETFKNEILSSVDDKNENLYNRVITLMAQYQEVFRAYTDSQIAIVNERIDNIEIGAISVYNPITGTVDPLQNVIDDLYNQLRYNAITAGEYDALELTATTYDGYMITADNFDLNGKTILIGN